MLPSVHKAEAKYCNSSSQRIRKRTANSVQHALAGGTRAIDQRLAELDREWDLNRAIETTASGIVLLGVTLGMTRGPRWFALPGIASAVLLFHSIRGWSPPFLRWLGVRTQREIDAERCALKAARGDFQAVEVASAAGPHTLLTLAEF